MNSKFHRSSVFSLSLATLTLLSGGLSVSAQTVEKTTDGQFALSASQISSFKENTDAEYSSPSFSNQTSEESNLSVNPELVTSDIVPQASDNVAPVPGTTATSSAALARRYQLNNAQYPQANFKPSVSSDLAQADIDFDGFTGGGSNYVGVAGNIGLGGDTALGDGNFMVISKVGLTDILSVRPSVVLGNDTVILVPVTYDFSLNSPDPFRETLPFSPYAGAGLAYQTGDNSELTFLLSGGVDLPISQKLTATAAINAAFFDETDIGLSVGVGYNFSGL